MRFLNILLIFSVCIMPSAFTLTRKPLIIAHRGASSLAPENTLSSVQLAWNLGARAVEIDIRLTKDKRIVLSHDPDTFRTSGVSAEIAHTDLERLKSLDFGYLKGSRFIGEKIATLDEILPTVPPGGNLFVEIKSGKEIVEPLADLLNEYYYHDRLTFIAFDYETLKQVKATFPHIAAYWLLGPTYKHLIKSASNRKSIIDMAKFARFDGLDAHKALSTLTFQRETQENGLKFFVWVVNDSGALSRLVSMGVDGITTDRPENNFVEPEETRVNLAKFQLRTTL